MKFISLVLASILALSITPAASSDELVDVTLDLTTFGLGYKSCDVQVPAGADGGAVLDAAVASGCIDSWSAGEYPGFGRYVSCIDNICEAVATYWAFYVNGGYSDVGIDGFVVESNDVLTFDYTQWVIPPLA